MPDPVAAKAEEDERRVYHAQLITIVAVVPTFMAFAAALTAAVLGDRSTRALLLANPVGLIARFAIAMLFVLAWWLLGRRQRLGAVLGLALFTWMLISSLRGEAPRYLNVAVAVAGLVFVARAWPALQPASVRAR